MKYHDYLTRRYLSRRWAPWAATVTGGLGVFSLLTVLAIMEGFKVEMRERIRGTLSHLVVEADPFGELVGEDRLLRTVKSIDEVKAAAPNVTTWPIYKVGVMDILRGSSRPPNCLNLPISHASFSLMTRSTVRRIASCFCRQIASRCRWNRWNRLFSLERRRDVSALADCRRIPDPASLWTLLPNPSSSVSSCEVAG